MYNSIYPVQIKPYVPPQNRQVVGRKEDEQESSSGSNLQKESRALEQSEQRKTQQKSNLRQQFPNGQQSAIDYSKSQVNISQIITDFKNTSLAIGTPDDVVANVNQYLAMAEQESLNGSPNKKIIQGNLRVSASILDEYISKTLNKDSKVVENWVEALFLQQVDYKSDPTSINPDFLVKMPDKTEKTQTAQAALAQEAVEEQDNLKPVQTEAIAVTNPQTSGNEVYIPKDTALKQSFIQGKKYAGLGEDEKALQAFQKALSRAQAVEDKEAAGMVCFEIGQIYDKNDYLADALDYYNEASKSSKNNNLIAKARHNMAQIYRDVAYFEPAMVNYYDSISYAGQADNFKAQSKSLSDIAEMFAEKYDKNSTIIYLNAAKNIVSESDDIKAKGAIWSKSGDALAFINENADALKDYKESAKLYGGTDSPIKMARNFEKASDIMLKLGNNSKAKSLLQKAFYIASDVSDADYTKQLSKKMQSI